MINEQWKCPMCGVTFDVVEKLIPARRGVGGPALCSTPKCGVRFSHGRKDYSHDISMQVERKDVPGVA